MRIVSTFLTINIFFSVPHDKPLTYEQCSGLMPKFHAFLKRCPIVEYLPEMLTWCNRLDVIVMSLHATTLTRTLILSSVLEYSLGNIFLSRTGITPPHLLRDLLMTDTLATELGETIIYLLRLLLGTPNGINLRNLVWHGFLSDEDLSPIYNNFLLLIMTSIGKVLLERNSALKHRSCSLDAQMLVTEMGLENFNELQLKNCLMNHPQISNLQLRDWTQTLKYYKKDQFFFCVSHALIQLEMYLRRLYGQLYRRDWRAKLDEYYIIMDTVFEEYNSITQDRNRMYDYFPNSLLELVYDLFSAMNGPRIRDKLSHGELQLDQVDKTMAEAVLYTCSLVIENDSKFTYRSVYHPNAIAQAKLKECKAALNQIKTLRFPKNLNDSEPAGDVPFIPEVYIMEKINIFHRPGGEEIVVGYLQRIATTLELAAKNLHQSLGLKIGAMERRELRSRARNTLNNMLKMLPTITGAFEHVLTLLVWIFHCLMEADELHDLNKLIR